MTGLFRGVLPEREILTNEPLARHTSFQAGGLADVLLLPQNEAGLMAALRAVRKAGVPFFVMGRGTNLLVSDDGFRGVVIKIAYGGATIRGGLLYADAGVSLRAAAMTAVKGGLCGLEFAAGIPGTLGGGVAMNAGAYGGELKDCVCEARVLAPDGSVKTLSNERMRFSYRRSAILEEGFVVLSAAFAPKEGDAAQSAGMMEEYAALRREKQPLEYPSAGSTFKRPTGHYAGALIERCGLKGMRRGGAQVSEKHAGFIVNTGGARARDIYALICEVRRVVLERTGVDLEPEIKFLGEFV